MIRKEVFVNEGIIEQLKKIVKDSEVMKEDDRNWPMPDKVGRQELEVCVGAALARYVDGLGPEEENLLCMSNVLGAK
eukprot:3403721-Rhodomonas_salina.2